MAGDSGAGERSGNMRSEKMDNTTLEKLLAIQTALDGRLIPLVELGKMLDDLPKDVRNRIRRGALAAIRQVIPSASLAEVSALFHGEALPELDEALMRLDADPNLSPVMREKIDAAKQLMGRGRP
jgi:hypothetical protein